MLQKVKEEDDNAEGARDDIAKILSSIKCNELQFKDEAVILDASTEPKKAIEILVKNHVRAAPVVNKNNFIGVLDLRDTLKYVLEAYKAIYEAEEADDDDDINNNYNKNIENIKNIENNKNNKLDDSKQDVSAMEYFVSSASMSSSSLTDLCNHRPFRVVNGNDTLLQLANIFALGSHVVGIVNDKKLTGVCTQGYFFQKIANVWKFKHLCTLNKLLQLKYITSPIKTINKNTRAVQAFELMNTLNLSGLAVVNDENVLVHNTSATDIKLWLLKGEQSLDDSIETFLINIRNLSLTERYPITVCMLNDSLKRAIQKLQATKYHRLWIVDQLTNPIGVLALTDVFRFIVAMNQGKDNNDNNNNNNNNGDDNNNQDNHHNKDNHHKHDNHDDNKDNDEQKQQ